MEAKQTGSTHEGCTKKVIPWQFSLFMACLDLSPVAINMDTLVASRN